MTKNIYRVLFSFCAALILGVPVAFSQKAPLAQTLTQTLPQKIEQKAEQEQIVQFFEKLAQKDPAKMARFLLENKMIYVDNPNIVYIGIKGTEEVLVICEVDDFEIGTFYYVIHKRGNRYATNDAAALPAAPQDFITLFKRVK